MAVGLSTLQEVAMALVLIGAVTSIGAIVLTQIGNDSSISADATASSIVNNSKTGVLNLTSNFGLIGTVAGLAAVLTIVVAGLFWMYRRTQQ